MKPIIYLDMDGVLADFEGWAKMRFGSDEEWQRQIKLPEWGNFKFYPNIFDILPVMPDAMELYEGCCEILGDKNRVQILTALPNRARDAFPNAVKHKIDWAHRNISPDIRVHFGPMAQHKQYHCKHAHDVLIDDMIRNIDQWNYVGGIGILHTSAINSLKALQCCFK